MFRSRTSSQKPGDDLLANFRQNYPDLNTAAGTAATVPAHATTAAEDPILLASAHERAQGANNELFSDQDPTPRASGEPWRFTPSLLDPNSFSFAAFANQPPGYYTPTPGGTNTIYHPQAGDLHTPNMANMGGGAGLGTPLSLPTSEGALQSGPSMMDMAQFQHGIPPQAHFQQPGPQHFNAFIQPSPHQASFAPSSFVHQDTGYETMDHDGSPLDSDGRGERVGSLDAAFHQPPHHLGFPQPHGAQFNMPITHMLPPSAEKFRFHSTLNAPTAMIKHADEIPITYLNKGQAYSLSVIDLTSSTPLVPGTKYRTFVRVSFEEDEQRQKPGVCWGLWKEGRGSNEAHQRGGKLQAVEYVEAGQPVENDDRRTRVELETSSFDGFSVLWTPGMNGPTECNIAVRFNFLSTDFSHSKGVKGIPVRLCAKTTMVQSQASPPTTDTSEEICYCKVKLFRDHGAERKLSNDVAHVKKTIDKLKQQIAQAESGLKDVGKRKRGSVAHKHQESQKPGKAPKHKRTWSMSSASSGGGGPTRSPIEDDLQVKLQTLQDMFTSTRPVSVLYLRGDDGDDPDLHPVSLPGEPSEPIKTESKEGNTTWQMRSARNSVVESTSLVSPSPSSMSLQSQPSGATANPQWTELHAAGSTLDRRVSDQPVRVSKTDEDGNLTGWIEAVGVDPAYRPPPERRVKPVACFYVLRKLTAEAKPEYHRAIYLTQRTISDFTDRLCAKWSIVPAMVVRIIRELESGIEVEVDDDMIREIPEGQNMALQVIEVERMVPQQKPREWDMAVDGVESDRGSAKSTHSVLQTSTGYEMRLSF